MNNDYRDFIRAVQKFSKQMQPTFDAAREIAIQMQQTFEAAQETLIRMKPAIERFQEFSKYLTHALKIDINEQDLTEMKRFLTDNSDAIKREYNICSNFIDSIENEELCAGFTEAFKGAHFALENKHPDYKRHAIVSIREIWDTISTIIPDDIITKEINNDEGYIDSKKKFYQRIYKYQVWRTKRIKINGRNEKKKIPTRRARYTYLFFHGRTEDDDDAMYDNVVDIVMSIYKQLCDLHSIVINLDDIYIEYVLSISYYFIRLILEETEIRFEELEAKGDNFE